MTTYKETDEEKIKHNKREEQNRVELVVGDSAMSRHGQNGY